MMEYPFFIYKEKPGAMFEFSPEGRFPFGRSVGREWPSDDTLERCAVIKDAELDAILKNDPVLKDLTCFDQSTKWRFGAAGKDGRRPMETVGATVKAPVRERERLFCALLGLAQRYGFSLADPLFGLLWASPVEEERRPIVWMRGRWPLILDEFQRCGRRQIFALPHGQTESFYVVVEKPCSGKPTSERALRFREDLGRCLWPGERLVAFAGRLALEGPDGAYRIHFNWEDNGKHASWTADFREPECPVIPTHRSPIRMLLRTPSARSLVAVGMEHPVVAECIPDPADRHASLYFCNRKLTKRVPREVVEELKAKKGCAKGTK